MTARHQLITTQELIDLNEIDRLLDEANAHSLAADGYCKSSEGNITVDLGNHWDRDSDGPRKPVRIHIYSYLLGPHRDHFFDNTKQALETVRVWHHNEMHEDDQQDDPYLALVANREDDMAQFMRDMDELYGEEVQP